MDALGKRGGSSSPFPTRWPPRFSEGWPSSTAKARVNRRLTFVEVMMVPLDTIRGWIRSSDLRRARAALEHNSSRRVDRALALDIASLASECEAPEIGLRVLKRYVRPPARRPAEATPRERAEYARCLVQCGALEEGVSEIERLEPAGCPRILLYRAIALEEQWSYGDAIPLLKRFLASGVAESELRLAAEAGLALAFVRQHDTFHASQVLRRILHEASRRKHDLFLARALELCAECLTEERHWDEAMRFLDQAARRLPDPDSVEGLAARKLRAAVTLRRDRDDPRARAELLRVSELALSRGHWEMARHCDYLVATACRDEALLAKLYFGTPFPDFRAKLISDFGEVSPDRLHEYVWGRADGRADLDLFSGKLASGKGALVPGSLLHRLLLALLSDFYRPIRTASLYRRTHPGALFHPDSSAGAVRDGLWRLRRWIREQGAPLAVHERGGGYVLEATSPFGVRLVADELAGRYHSPELRRLGVLAHRESFSIADAQDVLRLPRRTVVRILREALDYELIVRIGQSRATRYVFLEKAWSE